MQNFSNSPAAASPGFPSRGINLVGSSYPPHLSDPQISPRMIEDYAAMQHHQPILQSHGQHLHLRGQQHPPVQMPHIHGYGPRRGAGEMPQAGAHSASSGNSYRKENMDYYFSLAGRDRNRRGGGGYGSGFGYANMDGHIPHQYRHISGSGPSSGMISPFPMDYSTSAASGGGSGVSSSGGSFSPSQQFGVAQNVPMQPQQSQKYPSHQGLHQGHRAYALSGHRIPSQFGQFPTLSAPAASPGMYNSPPLRYETGASAGGMDSKVNSSPTQSNPNPNPGSAAPHNSGHQENVGQGYPPTNHPAYSPQSHSVPKHTSRRTPQHNPGASYDASLKMQHSQPHLKNNQSSLPSPHHASQDVSKSPMHSQNQQGHMNQNFSPISNPSPAPSAVHSPSCSSSSSPLMGVPEGLNNSASLHPSLLNPRGSQGHTRPQQTMAQLSPTPSSNSSVSSCGSAASSAVKQNRARVQQERISQDLGVNSLNALTSQVANLPNTVQHMMLTDTVLSQKKNRDLQQAVTNQQKTRNASAPGPGTSNEGDEELEEARKGHIEQTECEKVKRSAGSGIDSKQANCYGDGSNETKTLGQNHPVSQTREPENQTSSSSSSPSPVPSYAEPSRTAPPCPPAPSASSSFTSSPVRATHSNCTIELDLSRSNDRTKKGTKDEKKVVKCEEASHQEEPSDGKNVRILTRVKVEDSGPNELDEGSNDVKKNAADYCSMKNLNTPEQSNAGVGVIVSARSDQNIEGSKPTEFDRGKLNFSDEKHSMSAYRNSANHNGDGAAAIDMYTGHYDVPSKNEFGQNMPSNHCYPGSFPYNSPEIPYSACMGAKNKGRAGAGGVMSATRYQDYVQPQSNFASRKDMNILGAIGRSGPGVGSRGHDNSQLQQPYPSLLQEVLQGYHLDRRYGRPDQTSGVHQPQNVYQTKLSYRMPESMRPHGAGQSAASGHQMGTGKVHTQNQGPDHEVDLRPTWDPEAPRPKEEKGTIHMSPSHSGHVLSSDPSPKHINLADYSLPHRKPPSLTSPPSAIQQLLLQESNQLSGNAEPVSQTQLHASLSSGRRSVICDVSPSRRTTPEKERGQFGASVSSVIQQPHTSSALNEQECSKEDAKDKKEREQTSKVDPGDLVKQLVDGLSAAIPKQESTKSLHAPAEVISDLQRHIVKKEVTEHPVFNSQLHMPSVPLSSPSRCKPYPKAVGTYGFGDAAEGSKVNAPHPSHNLFHSLSASNHTPSSANKLQTYPHQLPLQQPHGMGDRFDWSESGKRPNDVSVNHNSVQNADQKCKIQSPTDVLPNQHHLARQQSYPGAHCDMKIWESYTDREGPGHQERRFAVPHKSVAKSLEADVSRGIMEESTKKLNPPAAVGTGGMGGNVVAPGVHQGPRPIKTGGSAETNPLMLRRRVRSFISPIPAKRQHQDSSHKAGSSYSPVASLESRHLNDADSGSVDTHAKISPGASSPPLGKTKILPPRKGRGLKLEAIVQKITPNKKVSYSNSHVDDDYTDVSHYSSDVPDPEMGVPFAGALNREAGCLPYLDEPHCLDDLLPYRAEDPYSCDPPDVKHGAPGSTGGTLRKLPTDFDFGLGTAGSSGAGMAEGDKDEFTLLGPLPPPPPLPCPVQGSPPPSSSALSDIQQFTSTYQQLETRRGEQSAANLLRQKLQDTGMGFDNYPGGDFYGATPSHGQNPGHHLLSRTPQHEFSSSRAAADTRSSDTFVPKGYFPSGKKKGRPVGSVNKQKRAQVQAQSTGANLPAAPHTPPAAGAAAVAAAATPQSVSNASPAEEAVITTEIPEQKPSPPLDLPAQSQPTKVEMEGEDSQPVADIKPVKQRQKKGKDNNDGPKSRQWRKRGGISTKGEVDAPADDGGNVGFSPDTRKNAFSPYIHVERKITEIGAVCTIINAEGGKSSGVDAVSNVSLTREVERVPLKHIDEQNESALQSGKSVPTSGYVILGPVVSETGQSGRLLCCLCQKWANYKNLGDLYGPFYPADYAAKLPKNQPQVRQSSSNHVAPNTGSNPFSASVDLTAPDTQLICAPDTSTASETTNPVSPAQSETLPCLSVNLSSTTTEVPEHNWEPMPDVAPAPITLDPPDLEKETPERKQQKAAEDLQQRPQHRKLTSHPRFKRRHKSGEGLPRTIPINSKASLPFQPPPPSLDSLGPLAQLAQLPVVPLDPKELWVHESCIVWTSGVYLVNGKLYGLQEALDGARETSCSHCEMAGSTLGCYSKGCTLRYHYLCAVEAECCLNEDNFSMRCPKHKFPLNGRPAKPSVAQLDQPERG